MNDNALILAYLADGIWHSGITMSRALKPDSVSWAYRSRIADINGNFRARGSCLRIQSRIGESHSSDYRLFKFDTPEAARAYDIERRAKRGPLAGVRVEWEGSQAVMRV